MSINKFIQFFPSEIKLPGNLKEKYKIERLYVRSFSSSISDLEINFNNHSMISLSVIILSNCLRNRDGEIFNEKFIWELPISKRIEILIKIAFLNRSKIFEFKFRCKSKSCKQDFEIILDKQDFYNFLQDINNYELIPITIDGKNFLIRKPTGFDQLNWVEKNYDKDQKVRIVLSLISTNLKKKKKPLVKDVENNLSYISSEFEKLDPLLNMSKTLECPYCNVVNEYFIDLNKFALEELCIMQNELIHTIHVLANAYNWNESDIISLPDWRRAQYIKLIDAKVN